MDIPTQNGSQQEALERKYMEGYQRKPDSPSVGKRGEKMAREVWPEESWDEQEVTPHPARDG